MESIDALPPQARFALRVVAAGLAHDDAARLLAAAPDAYATLLRTAAHRAGVALPSPGSDAALRDAALAPLVAAARGPSARRPATRCPQADVLRAFAAEALAGPLLLATAEHVADCPACLDALVRLRREGPPPAEETARPVPGRRRGASVACVALALAALGAVAWLLLRAR